MSTPYVVVTLVAAAMAAFSAVASFLNLGFAVASLVEYGVPRSYFVGAVVTVVTVVRAGRYAHIPFPLVYLAPAAGSLGPGLRLRPR
ncbi:hypothetical protein [Actinokineospora sp.]|uniref:hypothetical protein n=1 Tax=Actinokineospora sp. TaxID=1872133 RepID=UPI003D6B92AC